jgi:hypothetical protein
MPKISKEKLYAIQYLLSIGKSIVEITKELKVTDQQVNDIISESKDKPDQSKKDKTKDLRISQTSAKKNNTVSIMTQAASQVGDEFYKNQSTNTKDTSNHIFRPRS